MKTETLLYIVIISILSIYVTHRIVGPMYRLEKDAMKLADTPDVKFRFKFRKKDEFQEVAMSLNKMMEKLESSGANR